MSAQESRPVDELVAEIRPLLTKKEKRQLRRARTEADRRELVESLWQAIDPAPPGTKGDLRAEWESRAVRALELFGHLDDERSETLLLAGEPDARGEDLCPNELWPIEVWRYAARGSSEAGVIVFVDVRESGDYRSWLGQQRAEILSRRPLDYDEIAAGSAARRRPEDGAVATSGVLGAVGAGQEDWDLLPMLLHRVEERCAEGSELASYLLEASSDRNLGTMTARLKSPRR